MLRLGAVGDARHLVVGEDEVVGAGARPLHAVEIVGADQAEVRARVVLAGVGVAEIVNLLHNLFEIMV